MSGVPDLAAAFLLGLAGSTHCLGMCGGISAALAFALGPRCSLRRRAALLLLMSTARVASYGVIGALAGALLPAGPGGPLPALRVAAGVLLVLMALSLAGWRQVLAPVEQAGQGVWNRIGPRAMRLARIDSVHGALIAGAAWGWLPCGLVYGTLAWAASSGETASAALRMLAFGAGTLPAVVASGAAAAQLRRALQKRELRLVAALLVAGFGVWTVATAIGGGHGHGL